MSERASACLEPKAPRFSRLSLQSALAHPELDDNVPIEITDTFVAAYERPGARVERVFLPGARNGFLRQPSADTEKASR